MNDIIIRDVKLEDVPRLLEIYGYYVENTAITFEYDVPDVEEFENRIKTITKKYPYIVAIKDGVIVGYAYSSTFKARRAYDYSTELTIYLDKNCTKSGVGKILYTELENRLKALGMKNLYACIGVPNVEDEYLTNNSAEFHEHMGYKLCGRFTNCGYKFNRWYSMVWMEKLVGEHN